MVLASDPVVLNALAADPVLGEPTLLFHTATFAVPGAQGGSHRDVLGETQVRAQPLTAPEPITAPFNLPVTTVHHAALPGAAFTLALAPWIGANARIVEVAQPDGGALPGWVHVDAVTGELHGHAPAHGPHQLRLLVATRDQQGHQMYREIVVDFGKGHASHATLHRAAAHASPAGTKPSLSEQFERERQSFHVVRSTSARPEEQTLAARSSISANHH